MDAAGHRSIAVATLYYRYVYNTNILNMYYRTCIGIVQFLMRDSKDEGRSCHHFCAEKCENRCFHISVSTECSSLFRETVIEEPNFRIRTRFRRTPDDLPVQ